MECKTQTWRSTWCIRRAGQSERRSNPEKEGSYLHPTSILLSTRPYCWDGCLPPRWTSTVRRSKSSHSKTDLIKSSDLMDAMREVFIATNKFVEGFPIDRYVLLFHF